MYWLLTNTQQENIRKTIDELVVSLSQIEGNPQIDQLFPYVGRKDRRKALSVVNTLSSPKGVVIDPFVGSGIFAYASCSAKRKCFANEWEPYAFRMSTAPWRLPKRESINVALESLLKDIKLKLDYLYKTICSCGHPHVLDTLFFDRNPLRYKDVTYHERLGKKGENVTYRGKHKCPKCGATEKYFDKADEKHISEINKFKIPNRYKKIFETALIENSRINLSADFLIYGSIFPHRSKLALCIIWDRINKIEPVNVKEYFQDAFLSILPQAKYKDYRSKSQDLHCPNVQLREVNLLYRYIDQINYRFDGLSSYTFSTDKNSSPIQCKDFRDFLKGLESNSVDLILTDQPWTDGNAYFEKAQLYHPWLCYSLKNDKERMAKEYVVTDAPTRAKIHDIERWWKDTEIFFDLSERVLKPLHYLTLFFRPIPASLWLRNLNRIKLVARKKGFEPLLSIDVANSDPSMRIQQSAAYAFSQDIIFVFVKLPNEIRRYYVNDSDIDQIVYQTSEELQEIKHGPFSYKEWRDYVAKRFIEINLAELNSPKMEIKLYELFQRYCDQVNKTEYLPKALTPFSGQLFDTPAIERLFTYIPIVINELTKGIPRFSFDRFLLRLSEYVENGTRMLIDQIEHIDLKKMIDPYARPIDEGRYFEKRKLPDLPNGLKNVLELDPYEFEAFVGRLLDSQGYTSIALIGRSGDRGVDLAALDPKGIKTVVQCKRYFIHKVDSTPVQRLHSFAITRGAKRKILITTSSFTKQAIDEAKITNTELVNGAALENIIVKYMPNCFE